MPGRFRRSRGRIEAKFDPVEAGLLTALFTSLVELLEGAGPAARPPGEDPLEELLGAPSGGAPPSDPVLARLFPDAYVDPDASAEFRRLTEGELRAAKLTHARAILDQLAASGGRVGLEPAAAEDWLTALNDLRLALATRLGITEESPEDLDRRAESDPRGPQLRVYEWLGYLQETLVRSLSR